MKRGLFDRIAYLVTRTIVRPERAVQVIEDYRPVLDLVVLTVIGLLWILLVNVSGMARHWVVSRTPQVEMADYMARAAIGYGAAILIMAVYSFCVSTAVFVLRGDGHYRETFLCFWLGGIIGLGVSVVPASVIKLVDYGGDEFTISQTIVTVLPWIYIVYLCYVASVRIFRNEGPQVFAYLVLGGLPILLGGVVLRGVLPSTYYAGIGWH